jgi:hypothetical protein
MPRHRDRITIRQWSPNDFCNKIGQERPFVGFVAVDIFWLVCHIFFICLRTRAMTRTNGSTGSVRLKGVKRQMSAASDKRLALGKGDAANQGIGATRPSDGMKSAF